MIDTETDPLSGLNINQLSQELEAKKAAESASSYPINTSDPNPFIEATAQMTEEQRIKAGIQDKRSEKNVFSELATGAETGLLGVGHSLSKFAGLERPAQLIEQKMADDPALRDVENPSLAGTIARTTGNIGGTMLPYVLTSIATGGASALVQGTAMVATAVATTLSDDVDTIERATEGKLNGGELFGLAMGASVGKGLLFTQLSPLKAIGLYGNAIARRNVEGVMEKAMASIGKEAVSNEATRKAFDQFGRSLFFGKVLPPSIAASTVEGFATGAAMKAMTDTAVALGRGDFDEWSSAGESMREGAAMAWASFLMHGIGGGLKGMVKSNAKAKAGAMLTETPADAQLNKQFPNPQVKPEYGNPDAAKMYMLDPEYQKTEVAWSTFEAQVPEHLRGVVPYMKNLAFNAAASTGAKPIDYIQNFRTAFTNLSTVGDKSISKTIQEGKMTEIEAYEFISKKVPEFGKIIQHVAITTELNDLAYANDIFDAEQRNKTGWDKVGDLSSFSSKMFGAEIGRKAAGQDTVVIGPEAMESAIRLGKIDRNTARALMLQRTIDNVEVTSIGEGGKATKETYSLRINSDGSMRVQKQALADEAVNSRAATKAAREKIRTNRIAGDTTEAELALAEEQLRHTEICRRQQLVWDENGRSSFDQWFDSVEPGLEAKRNPLLPDEVPASPEGMRPPEVRPPNELVGAPENQGFNPRENMGEPSNPLLPSEIPNRPEGMQPPEVPGREIPASPEGPQGRVVLNSEVRGIMNRAETKGEDGTRWKPEDVVRSVKVDLKANKRSVSKESVNESLNNLAASLGITLKGGGVPEAKAKLIIDAYAKAEKAGGLLMEASAETDNSPARLVRGLYLRSNDLAIFMKEATGATVAHEYLHHLSHKGLLPDEIQRTFIDKYGTVTPQGDKVWSAKSDEAMVDDVMGYIFKSELPEGSDPRLLKALDFIKETMASTYRDIGIKHPELEPLFGALVQAKDTKSITDALGRAVAEELQTDLPYSQQILTDQREGQFGSQNEQNQSTTASESELRTFKNMVNKDLWRLVSGKKDVISEDFTKHGDEVAKFYEEWKTDPQGAVERLKAAHAGDTALLERFTRAESNARRNLEEVKGEGLLTESTLPATTRGDSGVMDISKSIERMTEEEVRKKIEALGYTVEQADQFHQQNNKDTKVVVWNKKNVEIGDDSHGDLYAGYGKDTKSAVIDMIDTMKRMGDEKTKAQDEHRFNTATRVKPIEPQLLAEYSYPPEQEKEVKFLRSFISGGIAKIVKSTHEEAADAYHKFASGILEKDVKSIKDLTLEELRKVKLAMPSTEVDDGQAFRWLRARGQAMEYENAEALKALHPDWLMLAKADLTQTKIAEAERALHRADITGRTEREAGNYATLNREIGKIEPAIDEFSGKRGMRNMFSNMYRKMRNSILANIEDIRGITGYLDAFKREVMEQDYSSTKLIYTPLEISKGEALKMDHQQHLALQTAVMKGEILGWSNDPIKTKAGRSVPMTVALKVYALAKGKTVDIDILKSKDRADLRLQTMLVANRHKGEDINFVNDIVESVNASADTKKDFIKTINWFTKQANESFDGANAVHRRRTGKDATKESGWYTPLVHETSGNIADSDPMSIFTSIDNAGFREKSIDDVNSLYALKGGGGVVSLDFYNDHLAHVRQLNHYAKMADTIVGITQLLDSPQVVDAMASRFHGDMKLLQNLAALVKAEITPSGQLRGNKITDIGRDLLPKLQGNAYRAYLAGNIMQFPTQMSSVFMSAVEVGMLHTPKLLGNMTDVAQYAMRNMVKPSDLATNWLKSGNVRDTLEGNESWELIRKWSPQIAERLADPDVALLRQGAALYRHNTTAKIKSGFNRMAFLLEFSDIINAVGTWRTAFDVKLEQIVRENPTLTEAQAKMKASSFANEVVSKTNNPSTSLDKNILQRGSPLVRSLIPFSGQSFVNMKYMLNNFALPIETAVRETSAGKGNLVSNVYQAVRQNRMVSRFAVGVVAQAALLGLIARRRMPENEKEVAEDFGLWLASSLPIIGPIIWAKAIMGYKDNKPQTFWQDLVSTTSQTINDTFVEQKNILNDKEMQKNTMRAFALGTGTPIVIPRLFFNIKDKVMNDEMKMETWGDAGQVWLEILTDKTKKESSGEKWGEPWDSFIEKYK